MKLQPSIPLFLQVSLFFRQHTAPPGKLVVQKLADTWWKRFDAEPMLLPLPPEAPPEVPTLIAQNRAGTESLNLSAIRADYRIDHKLLHSAVDLKKELVTATNLMRALVELGPTKVLRIGVVIRRVEPCKSAAMELARYFAKSDFVEAGGALGRTEAFELHAHKRYKMPRFGESVNSWVRNRSGSLVSGEEVVLVEQDINTPQENDTQEYSSGRISDFLGEVLTEFDGTLRRYYPGEAFK